MPEHDIESTHNYISIYGDGQITFENAGGVVRVSVHLGPTFVGRVMERDEVASVAAWLTEWSHEHRPSGWSDPDTAAELAHHAMTGE